MWLLRFVFLGRRSLAAGRVLAGTTLVARQVSAGRTERCGAAREVRPQGAEEVGDGYFSSLDALFWYSSSLLICSVV